MTCIYCGSPGPYSDEHVLPRALAGDGEWWVLRNSVCSVCNGAFSSDERNWIHQDGVALARISLGPLGRKRRGVAFVAHPSENWYLKAENDPVFYEVDVLPGMAGRFRTQIIATQSRVIVRAGDVADTVRFQAAFGEFLRNPEVTIQKRAEKGSQQFRVAVMTTEPSVRVVRIDLRERPTNAWVDRFPEFHRDVPRHPRLSIDAWNRLRFRVHSLHDIPFLLDRTFAERVMRSDGGTIPANAYSMMLMESRTIEAVEGAHRAIAKTVVNYAAHEFGPEWISMPDFQEIRAYCRGKLPRSRQSFVAQVPEASVAIPAIQRATTSRHAMALQSDGQQVVGWIRLYGGPIFCVHLGRAPTGTFRFRREVHIDYNGPGRVPIEPEPQ